MEKKITSEDIEIFMNGHDTMERIVFIDYKYRDAFVTIHYRDEEDKKHTTKQNFFPFCWAKRSGCLALCNGDKKEISRLMKTYDIGVKMLSTDSINGEDRSELFENGYLFMFYAKKPTSMMRFNSFFNDAGVPLKPKSDKEKEKKYFLCPTPQEQFMIETGKRFFKGYNDYDDVYRMTFDLETTGLDPYKKRITQIGVRTNRGFEKIIDVIGDTKEELDKSELDAIDLFFFAINTYKPDIITAHNGENFDWYFIQVRCTMLGTSIEELSRKYFNGESIHKEDKESVLKLGGETEKYFRTIVPFTTITDSMHAVRRAQAVDSNFQSATLKYATKYLGMKKENRVYTEGENISKVWSDLNEHYAFNDKDGDWYLYDKNAPDIGEFVKGKDGDNPFKMYTRNYIEDGYELVSGKYIIERYLFDDLWECDKVEHKLNTTNFLICKLLPLPFSKCTTMGTAGQWKSLLMAWSFENNLAIPSGEHSSMTVGGLSRLLRTGFVKNVIKLDYNSLYPSIILTWGISDDNDLMDTLLKFLEFVLTEREKYKGLKKKAGIIVDELKAFILANSASEEDKKRYYDACADFEFNDKKQSQMKVFGNSFFGSLGSVNPDVFPWKSNRCADQTTSIGRQCLRLMISHFNKLGYNPIVGDSVTSDTPLFIRYKDTHEIDIKPISEIFDATNSKVDELGREYEYGEKNFEVLCRSGWSDVNYVYRHKTNKDIYRISDGDAYVDVTKDHSVFREDKTSIKPNEISSDTKLEFNKHEVKPEKDRDLTLIGLPYALVHTYAVMCADNGDCVNKSILNSTKECKRYFYKVFMENQRDDIEYSKTCLAGILYIKRMIS